MTITVCDQERKPPKSALNAIRLKCLDCSNGGIAEIRECIITDCPLYEYRFGKNPPHRKKKLSAETRKKLSERMRKMARSKKT